MVDPRYESSYRILEILVIVQIHPIQPFLLKRHLPIVLSPLVLQIHLLNQRLSVHVLLALARLLFLHLPLPSRFHLTHFLVQELLVLFFSLLLLEPFQAKTLQVPIVDELGHVTLVLLVLGFPVPFGFLSFVELL